MDVDQSRQELLDYLRRVEERLDAATKADESSPAIESTPDNDDRVGFDSDEDRNVFLNNVLEELRDRLFRVACDMRGSRVLEKMATYFDMDHLATLLEGLQSHMYEAVTNRYASHVLQTVSSKLRYLSSSDEHFERVLAGAKALASTVIESLNDLVTDTYGSHVVRALLFATAGLESDEFVARSYTSSSYRRAVGADRGDRQFPKPQSRKGNSIPYRSSRTRKEGPHSKTIADVMSVPDELFSIHQSLLEALQGSDNHSKQTVKLQSWITDTLACPVFQAAMNAITATTGKVACTSFCRRLFRPFFEEEPRAVVNEMAATRLPLLLKDRTASHLLEKAIQTCTTDLVHDVYIKGVRNQALDMAIHEIANFVIQRLFQHMSEEDCVLLLQELMPCIEDILAEERAAVVVEMARAAVRCNVLQASLFKALLTAFHIPQDEIVHCLNLFLSLTTLDQYREQVEAGNCKEGEITCTSTGSQLVQALLQFDKKHITGLISGFVRLQAPQLVSLSCKTFGSYVFQRYFSKNTSVDGAQKMRLIKVLIQQHSALATLATHAAGSHVLDSIWECIDVKTKEEVARQLLDEESRLKESVYGRRVIYNCRLPHFKRQKEEWAAKQKSIAAKKEMFKDIIDDTSRINQMSKEQDHQRNIDEIDEVFHLGKRAARKLLQPQSSDTVGVESALAPVPSDGGKPRKNKKKQFKDLSFINAALTATKGKKKRKKKEQHMEDQDVVSTKKSKTNRSVAISEHEQAKDSGMVSEKQTQDEQKDMSKETQSRKKAKLKAVTGNGSLEKKRKHKRKHQGS
eukprot:gene3058-5836_t